MIMLYLLKQNSYSLVQIVLFRYFVVPQIVINVFWSARLKSLGNTASLSLIFEDTKKTFFSSCLKIFQKN